MNYANWISFRYLTASKGRFLTFLNFISVAGVAIGVMALIVVIAIMTGFGNNLRDKIIGTTPHLMIEKETGIADYRQAQQKLSSIDGVIASSPYVQGNIFLENSTQALGLVVRGVNPKTEGAITKFDQYLIAGSPDLLKGDNVIIGKELARYFGYEVGDQITLISPGSGIAGEGWRYKLNVAGVFHSGMAEYDMNLVLVPLAKGQEIFRLENDKVSGIGVHVEDAYKANDIKQSIYGVLGYGFLVRSWIDLNHNLFEALFLEKWGLFLILTLMVLVASFNIISTLIVTVMSKIHDIGILQSIGVPKHVIRKIFTKQGVLMGFTGTLLGCAGGFGLCYVLKTYVKVPEEIYSIDRVPVEIQTTDVAAIVIASMTISYFASIYPASKAARLQPVEALRYE